MDRARNLEMLWQDLGYGARLLRKNPGFSLLALVTLGLGIGVNTAIFSIIYGVLLKPLPYGEGQELVVIRQQTALAAVENMNFSVKEIEDYRGQNRSFEAVVEHHSMSFILYGGREPERIQTGVVSHDFFAVLGIKPLMGRTFTAEDEEHGAEAVLVLSYPYWQRSHGGDPNILGRSFAMNDRPHTVVGILPPIPQFPNDEDLYMPTTACPTRSAEAFRANRNARMMNVVARLRPGVGIEAAQADLSAIANRLRQTYPDSYPESRGYRADANPLRDELTRRARTTFLILLATAGLVLLIACANVANLTLARLMRREREMSIRAALGAGKARIVRQLLTESSLLALLGGGLGLLLAYATLDILVAFAARFSPRAAEIQLDSSILAFTLGVSLLTGIISGWVPAASSRKQLLAGLKDGGRQTTDGPSGGRARQALLVAQVAVSFMLLIVAGLMLRSLFKLQQVDPGFRPENTLVLRMSPNWSRVNTAQLFRDLSLRVVERIEQQPGVIAAAAASTYPLNPLGIANGPNPRALRIEGRSEAEEDLLPRADIRSVTHDYFRTAGLPLIMGRTFQAADGPESPLVAVINQSLARRNWGRENPLQQRVSGDGGRTWATIVGVVGDVRQYGLDHAPADELYVNMAQAGTGSYLLVRSTVAPMSLVPQIRRVVDAVDSETAIDQVRTLQQAHSESIASPRLTALLLGLFAALALLITAAGIAGVMALSVSQRGHEIGIRMALGATQGSVVIMILKQGMRSVFIGLALGSVGALLWTRVLSTLLFSTEPTDPLTFFAVFVVLVASATTACLIPAMRITGIDPLKALRSE